MNAVVVVLAVAAGGALAVLQHRRARARDRDVAAWARARGLAWRPGPDRALPREFLAHAAFARRGEPVARNVCRGERDGREVLVFDLVGAARDGEADRALTAVLVKADFPLIPLRIRRESPLERFAEALGDDIDFESAAFSDRFHVSSADRRFAREVIHPRMMEYLLAHASWPIELAGWHCLVWSPGRLPARRLDEAVALARGVLERVPDHVRRGLLGRPDPGR